MERIPKKESAPIPETPIIDADYLRKYLKVKHGAKQFADQEKEMRITIAAELHKQIYVEGGDPEKYGKFTYDCDDFSVTFSIPEKITLDKDSLEEDYSDLDADEKGCFKVKTEYGLDKKAYDRHVEDKKEKGEPVRIDSYLSTSASLCTIGDVKIFAE